MSSERRNDAPALSRVLGLWGAVWMGLGSILGTGVFVSLGIATSIVGSGIVVAVVLAALVATANGLSSAQLAAAHPVSGGTYEYGHRFVHPKAGFAAGWMFLAAKSASAATAALGCAGYLLHTLDLDSSRIPRTALAFGIVLLLTTWVAGGVQRSNRANGLIVAFTLLALASFVVFGWVTLDASDPAAWIGVGTWGEAFGAPASLLHATALIFVAYTGYGRIATLGEEVRDPARTIPRAIVLTLVISMAIYVAVSLTAVSVVGPKAFAASTREVAAPLEVVAQSFRHPGVAWVIAAGAVTAMAGVLLNLLLGLSRVLLAMSRRHEMPAGLRVVSEVTGSPTHAVWAVGGFIAGLTLFGDVRITWSFSAFTVLVYYGITNLAALRLPEEARRYPRWVAVAGLLCCTGLAFFVAWPAWLAGLGLLGFGFAFRSWMLRKWRH